MKFASVQLIRDVFGVPLSGGLVEFSAARSPNRPRQCGIPNHRAAPIPHPTPPRPIALALIVLIAGFIVSASFAAEKSRPTKRGAKPSMATSAPVDKSVETIADLVRPSVVTILHFGRDGKQDGEGAGFIVSSNGLIATSLHVIGEARRITVELAGGKRSDVTEVYAWDRKLDLAVIRVAMNNLPALPLGDSDALKQGTPIVAIGNPLGLEHSVVAGVVSARRDFDGVEMIQLAIPIEPGNSGGPMLDLQGRVHGILTLKSAMSANLGFAMPINALKPLLAKPNPVPIDRWLAIGALDPKEWSPRFGARWSRKAGHIHAEGLGKSFGGRSLCLFQAPVPPTPYEIQVAVKLDDESGAAGLVFDADGGDKHYGFYPSGGQLRLTRFAGPDVFSWTILSQVQSPFYRPGGWNTLKVRCERQQIFCYVNGHLVTQSHDQELPAGKVGLAKFRDTRADFKDFQLGRNLVATEATPSAEMVTAITKQIGELAGKPDAEAIAILQPHAEIGQSLLRERARQLDREATRLRQLAAAVHRRSVQQDLIQVLAAPEPQIDLFHAALLVSKLDNADLDLAAYRREVDRLARELAGQLPPNVDDAAKLAALNRYLFTENGFHGSRGDFYDRANSYINQVIDDREGIPITLSVLYVELARRIGLELSGVSLPGHFVVRYAPKKGAAQFIDVYDNGKVLSRAEAETMAEGFTGEPARDEQLQPATKRDIVVRMLHNLLGIAQHTESSTEALGYLDVSLALEPDAALDRLDRAMVRVQTGDTGGAKQDLKWLLDHQPRGVDLDRIADLYHSL
jgi:regulator of sirC expression with transglutaminase-like and TPR domain